MALFALSPDLEEKIRNRSIPIEKLLQDQIVVDAFRLQNEDVIIYFKKGIKSLVRFAVSEERSVVSQNAFSMLTVVEHPLAQTIINDRCISTFYTILFDKGTPPDFVLSKFTNICMVTFSARINDITEQTAVYGKLLKNINNLDVYYMYASLYQYSERYTSIKTELEKIDIPELIFDLLTTLNYDEIDAEDPLDPILWTAYNCYSLLQLGFNSSMFRQHFMTYKIMGLLLSNTDRMPQKINDIKWSAISSFTNYAEPVSCLAFLDLAVQQARDLDAKITAQLVSAINVCANLGMMSPNIFDEQFLGSMLLLLTRYPNATFLHKAIVDCIKTGIGLIGVDTHVCIALAPFFLMEIRKRENGSVYAAAYQILIAIGEQTKKSEPLKKIVCEIGDLDQVITTEISEYQRILDSSYGGETSGLAGVFRNLFS